MDLTKHAFFEGRIVPLSEARINIATHGFLYGTAVFGGLRAYWNEEKKRLFVFRPYDHFRRLLHSGKMMAMETKYDEESLIQLTLDLLRTDNWQQDLYMRPTFYKADIGIGVKLHDLKDEFCMFVMAYEPYVKNDTNAHLTISSWKRIDDNVIPARGKVAGAYANSALIKTDANRAGFDEALVLDN
ncbi:MAG TPA: aminotransferase class IV, partial [Anaerolineales bacterium]|nr:aminotransferase class IV [Anaerolineales bacterium]